MLGFEAVWYEPRASQMASDERQSRAERYRELAGSLTALARRTHFHEVREQLLTLAEQFDRMAEFADRWEDIER